MKQEKTISKQNMEDVLLDHDSRIEELEKKKAPPISIPAAAINAAAKAITEKVCADISITRCAPPDPKALRAEFCQAVLPAIESRIRAIDLNVRTKQVVELEDETRRRLNELGDSIDQIRRNFDVKPRFWWQLIWNRMSVCIIGTLILILTTCGLVYFNSPTYWGKRFYDVCNHPQQTSEEILKYKNCAYEKTILEFRAGKDRKANLKRAIREEELRLKGDSHNEKSQ